MCVCADVCVLTGAVPCASATQSCRTIGHKNSSTFRTDSPNRKQEVVDAARQTADEKSLKVAGGSPVEQLARKPESGDEQQVVEHLGTGKLERQHVVHVHCVDYGQRPPAKSGTRRVHKQRREEWHTSAKTTVNKTPLASRFTPRSHHSTDHGMAILEYVLQAS